MKYEDSARNKNKKRNKLVPVSQFVLAVIGATTLISMASIMPGVILALKKFGVDKKLINRQKYYVNDSLNRLIKKGLVVVTKKEGKEHLKLTPQGKRALTKFQTKELVVKIPSKWDGKYRVVVFDIKESEKFIREEIRFTLVQCGFIKLQNSVWVYPFPCEGIIHLLRTNLEIEEELVYMVVDSIENDSWIRKHFKLPPKLS